MSINFAVSVSPAATTCGEREGEGGKEREISKWETREGGGGEREGEGGREREISKCETRERGRRREGERDKQV